MDAPSNETTADTAFFHIGAFKKGNARSVRGSSSYLHWMKGFAYLSSPLVAFFDYASNLQHFAHIRAQLSRHKTELHLIERNQTWAFGLYPNISRLFQKPEYPKHHPNTMVPAYSCAVYAKYELTLRVVRLNPFNTKYFCWVDMGYFRHFVDSQKTPFRWNNTVTK